MQNDFDPIDQELQQSLDREAAGQAQELAAKREAADFRWLMNDPRGRRIVWAQLSASGVFRTSWSPDAMQMAFNEGHRSHGLRVLAQIHATCPDLYHTMMKEQLQ